MIDADKEIAKLGDKKTKLSNQLKKLQEAAAKPDYITKVPENVRTQNTEKVFGILVVFDIEIGIEHKCLFTSLICNTRNKYLRSRHA